jgi:hypothetical protein
MYIFISDFHIIYKEKNIFSYFLPTKMGVLNEKRCKSNRKLKDNIKNVFENHIINNFVTEDRMSC